MPKPRQPLNQLQTEVLLILYKFRFATRDLIVSYQELASRSYTQERLSNLLEQGYLGRRYSGKDKLVGKPARYYLEARGIRFLLAKPVLSKYELNPNVLNLTYKDKQRTEEFINLCIDVFNIYTIFNKQYGNNVDFYTKSEIADQDHFLKPLPDAFISFSGKYSRKPDYMLDLISKDKPYFVVRRRINQYLKQYEKGAWQNKTNTDYPHLLFVANDSNLERRMQKSIAFSLNSKRIRGLKVYTTTTKSLLNSNANNKKIWSDVVKPEKLLSL